MHLALFSALKVLDITFIIQIGVKISYTFMIFLCVILLLHWSDLVFKSPNALKLTITVFTVEKRKPF